MGGKRRFSKHQGIRKKRKNGNKQTLARVAERKEEQHATLERKLADAESRIRETRLAMLGGISQAQESEIVHDPESIQYDDDEEDDERRRIVISKIENQQNAYQNLSKSLETSIFDGEVDGKQRKKPQKSEKPAAKRPRIAERKARLDVNGDGSPIHVTQIAEEDIPQQTIERENYSAAIREKAHFDSSVKPLSLEGKLAPIGTLPGGGKVSGLVAEDRRNKLEACLKTDLAKFGASRIGMPTSVYSKWRSAIEGVRAMGKHGSGTLKSVHSALIAVIREYHDLFLSYRLSTSDEDMVRRLYVAHCFSHILRCRGRVIRNDAAKKEKVDEELIEGAKDQGFSRARVLLLLPFKNLAYEAVKMLQHLAVGAEEGEKDVSHIANSERFEAEFAPESVEDGTRDGVEGNSESFDIENPVRTSSKESSEHAYVFRGNIDDDFKLGIAFSKKTMKLYTDFYSSDIIIASPLGLRRTIAEKASGQGYHSQKRKEKENEDAEWKTGLSADAEKPKFDDADEDFLSSIEICVVDGTHVFSMQNWDTLLETITMINKMPVGTRDTDFSRVRDWCLDGLMRRFRQTIVLSSYKKSEFMTLFRELSNHAGKIQITEPPKEYGSMSQVAVRMRQTFFKVPEVSSHVEVPEKRMNFFFEEMFPQIRALLDSQCLLVVPNYFDFVRVRNILVNVNGDDPSFRFATMCEYSKGSDISRARSKLFDRSVSMVVMTERFHFFWRHWIRGANTVVWYGLPENCHYYPEILNMTMEAAEVGRPVQSMAMYDSFDAFALEQIVGRRRCKKMIAKDSRSTFLFA